MLDLQRIQPQHSLLKVIGLGGLAVGAIPIGIFIWFLSPADATPSELQAYQGERFSIQLPADLTATSFPLEDGQEMFVFENDQKTGFQISTQAIEGPLTKETIRNELPDLVIDNLAETSVDGQPALAFRSDEPDFGETFEVWFAYNGLLYQVMTYGHREAWLTDILKTWKFR